MSLADNLAVPPEFRERQTVLDDGTIEVAVKPVKSKKRPHPQRDQEIMQQFGWDPTEYELQGTVNQYQKEQPDGSWLTTYFFRVQPREYTLDLPALISEAKRKPRKPLTKRDTAPSRVTVVCLSDIQAGKVGSRGGTPELIDRLAEKRVKMEAHLKARNPMSTVLVEAGDIFEGFESGGNPMFTNDLSPRQQRELAGITVIDWVDAMQRHGHVDVLAVPSNHTAWRRGKQEQGRPFDDGGLEVHWWVAKYMQAKGVDATWHVPAAFDESVILDVLGTVIGVHHGHRGTGGPERIPAWWAGQIHGGQPIGLADILITGHYHHLRVLPTGRNPHTQRSKWWLQCPTLDNGSDWFRNRTGDDSDPGLLVFDITEEGFDLQSLTVL